jgi:plasmid stabilization system protein ParE
VAQVVCSAASLDAIERTVQSLHERDAATAAGAAAAIRSAIGHLAAHPLVGARLEGELRTLVVSYGATGTVALYRFVVAQDEVRLLAIRHQRELGFRP